MPSALLNDDRWRVETGGVWRLLWPALRRDLDRSNWCVIDKKTGEKWQLQRDEQKFLEHVAERLLSPAFSLECFYKPKAERKRLAQIVLADCVDAIAMNRMGDNSKLEYLSGLSQPEFTAYAFALWDL